MSIADRLNRLETTCGVAADVCPECGRSDGPIDYTRVVWTLHTDSAQPSPPVPCGTCGRMPISFTLNIGERRREVSR
jgi:hypothetical protein